MDAVGMKRTITGAAGLVLALAGCATQAAATTVSPAKLLASGTQALVALKSSQVTGTFTIDGVGGSVLASILQNGDITGTLDIGASESPFVYAGRHHLFPAAGDIRLVAVLVRPRRHRCEPQDATMVAYPRFSGRG